MGTTGGPACQTQMGGKLEMTQDRRGGTVYPNPGETQHPRHQRHCRRCANLAQLDTAIDIIFSISPRRIRTFLSPTSWRSTRLTSRTSFVRVSIRPPGIGLPSAGVLLTDRADRAQLALNFYSAFPCVFGGARQAPVFLSGRNRINGRRKTFRAGAWEALRRPLDSVDDS